jgi:hypothetical protein
MFSAHCGVDNNGLIIQHHYTATAVSTTTPEASFEPPLVSQRAPFDFLRTTYGLSGNPVWTHALPQLRTSWGRQCEDWRWPFDLLDSPFLYVLFLLGVPALPGCAHVQQELVNTRPPPLHVSHLLLHRAQEHEVLVEGDRFWLPIRHVFHPARTAHQGRNLLNSNFREPRRPLWLVLAYWPYAIGTPQ